MFKVDVLAGASSILKVQSCSRTIIKETQGRLGIADYRNFHYKSFFRWDLWKRKPALEESVLTFASDESGNLDKRISEAINRRILYHLSSRRGYLSSSEKLREAPNPKKTCRNTSRREKAAVG
jgi:hypothetical protein